MHLIYLCQLKNVLVALCEYNYILPKCGKYLNDFCVKIEKRTYLFTLVT